MTQLIFVGLDDSGFKKRELSDRQVCANSSDTDQEQSD